MKAWKIAATSSSPVEHAEPICAELAAVVGAVVGAIEEHVAD